MSFATVLKGLLVVLLGFIISGALAAQDIPAVQHTISFPLANSQYIHVRSEFPPAQGEIELAMPAWTPGSYKVRDFAAHVERMEARDRDGRPLSVEKVAKNRWRLGNGAPEGVVVEYDVWAGRQNVSENWVENGFAVINGAGVFLYSDHTLEMPQWLTIEPADSWPRAATALHRRDGPFEFSASNYHELVDSPLLIGETEEATFKVDGQSYRLALAEPNPLWDMDKATRDIAALVEAHQDFWQTNPLEKEYVFLLAFIGRYSGLEHDHSTLMLTNRWAMRERSDYFKFLELVSHEFFHVWNARRLRPASLVKYNYDVENYSRELWLAEGLTSYYDHMMLFRSGLVDVGDYLSMLAGEIRNYEIMPGRQVRSAELASFDAWVKQYEPDPNRLNSTVSYYRKGALIGLTADIEIRRATNGDHSLDDVMRALYLQHGPEGSVRVGYTREDFERIVEELAGSDVRDALRPLYASTQDPDVDRALDWVGLKVIRGKESDQEEPELGVTWDDEEERLRVRTVILGQPAAEAGVLPGDEVLAIDGLRLTAANYQRIFSKFMPGDPVDLLLSRNSRVLTVPVNLGARIPQKYSIIPKERLRNRDKQRLEDWLGRPLRFTD